MGIIIKAENLGKKYIIRHQRRGQYITLRDIIMHKMRGIGQRFLHPLSPNKEIAALEEFWALKDINFEIEQGDSVGIIGRNGAGKSTLLKILSRITEPTTGKIRLKGRVASLLEIGTGFHPELTGRENIYLNGAILGMARAEIKRKFNEIVAFAEIERFLDTPVKHYSSGMYVRLAFAVAAHLEPEILIVDEVLAVGDAQFQKKCLGKMEEVGREGRTVLFVSHNMGAIQQLTNRCIMLQNGYISFFGEVSQAVEHYLSVNESESRRLCENIKTTTDDFFIKSFNYNEKSVGKGFNSPISFILALELKKSFHQVLFRFGIVNSLSCRIMTIQETVPEMSGGKFKAEFAISDHKLPPGTYSVVLIVSIMGNVIINRDNAITFSISDNGVADPFLVKRRDRIGVFLRPVCNITEITGLSRQVDDALWQ